METNSYQGLYRLDSLTDDGLPDEKNPRDFSFIRVQVKPSKFWIFNKYENWRPTRFPPQFQLPPDKLKKLRNWEQNPRMFEISFEGIPTDWVDVGPKILHLRFRLVEITKVLEIKEV